MRFVVDRRGTIRLFPLAAARDSFSFGPGACDSDIPSLAGSAPRRPARLIGCRSTMIELMTEAAEQLGISPPPASVAATGEEVVAWADVPAHQAGRRHGFTVHDYDVPYRMALRLARSRDRGAFWLVGAWLQGFHQSTDVDEVLAACCHLEPIELLVVLNSALPHVLGGRLPRPRFSDRQMRLALESLPAGTTDFFSSAAYAALAWWRFPESASLVLEQSPDEPRPTLRHLCGISEGLYGRSLRAFCGRFPALAVLDAFGDAGSVDFRALDLPAERWSTVPAVAARLGRPCLAVPCSPLTNPKFVDWLDRTRPRFGRRIDEVLVGARRRLRAGRPGEAAKLLAGFIARARSQECAVAATGIAALVATDSLTPAERGALLGELSILRVLPTLAQASASSVSVNLVANPRPRRKQAAAPVYVVGDRALRKCIADNEQSLALVSWLTAHSIDLHLSGLRRELPNVVIRRTTCGADDAPQLERLLRWLTEEDANGDDSGPP